MSSLSILPYGSLFDYWYEKLNGKRYRAKFLVTKIIEVIAFTGQSGSDKRNMHLQVDKVFLSKKNDIPLKPIISLVIPAYVKTNKCLSNIGDLFLSIEKQILKPNYVIVVDDCSPLTYNFPDTTIFHKLEINSGPAKARNIGKQIALQYHSDIIAFTDTDCILSENWIENIITNFVQESDFHLLSGNTVSFDKHWFGKYHDINGTLNGRKFKDSENLLYGTTANLAISRGVAQTINFNENFPFAAGEDLDFCFRANKQGFAIKHIPTMIVQHNFGYSKNQIYNLKKFYQLFKKYGRGEKILLKEIPEYYAYYKDTEEIPTIIVE